MERDSDDNVSLNSTESEDYGDKEFVIRAIHAEKIDEDGTKKWLVAWEGYLSDDNLWLPRDAFTDGGTSINGWETKKKKIEKGVIKPYDWEEWDRIQANLELQRAIDKKRRQDLRARRRKGAVKRNGRWLDPLKPLYVYDFKRPRSPSDESYVDEDDSDVRSPKRTFTEIYSDSDDDKPLIPAPPSTTPKIGQPNVARSKIDKGKGPANPRIGFSLPIRTSQSPLPTEGPSESFATAINKHKLNGLEEIPPKPRTQGKSTLTVPNEATTSKATSQPPKGTAMRPNKPKSQSILRIPKRVLDKKGKPSSENRKPTTPITKDFYGLRNQWRSELRGRDEPAPNVDNLNLVSIPNATNDRGRQFNRMATDVVDPNQSNITGKENQQTSAPIVVSPNASASPPIQPGGPVKGGSGSGTLRRTNTDEERMDIDEPFSKGSAEKEPSLFVEDSQEVIDGAAGVRTHQRSVSQPLATDVVTNPLSTSNSRTAATSSETSIPPSNAQSNHSSSSHTASKENLQSGSSRSVVQENSVGKHENRQSRNTARRRGSSVTGPRLDRIYTEIDGIQQIPMGTISSIEYRDNRHSSNEWSHLCTIADSKGFTIDADIRGFRNISLQSLFKDQDNGATTFKLSRDQKCSSFEAFKNEFHEENKHMYFSSGSLQARPRHEKSARYVHEAWICFRKHFALLIWPTKSGVWTSVTKSFLGEQPKYPTFGCIMFQPPSYRNDQHTQSKAVIEASTAAEAPADNPKSSIEPPSDRGVKLIDEVLVASIPYSDKLTRLQSIFAEPSTFPSAVTEEQKAQLLMLVVQSLPKDEQFPEVRTVNEKEDNPQISRDPRLRRRQSSAAEAATPNLQSPSQDKPKLSFYQLKEQYQRGEPYTSEGGILKFKQLFGIDWGRMTDGKYINVPVMIVYPPNSALDEHEFLDQSFLPLAKANRFSLMNQGWEAFKKLSLPIPQHFDQSGKRPSKGFDAQKHVKQYTGDISILLVHKSLDDLSKFKHIGDLWQWLRNPNFKVFRISLGEPYQAPDGTIIEPESGIQELAKDGQQVLITDSVFVHHPQDALLIFKYLQLKLEENNAVIWKISGRPGLANWLLKLQDAHKENQQKAATYASLHAYVNKLVPYEQRKYTHLENEWIPIATAALEIPQVIEGYKVDAGLGLNKDGNSDLTYNDKLLVEWFSQVTRRTVKQIRSLVVVLDDRTAQKGLQWKWKHVRIISTTEFVRKGQVQSTLLKDEWKKKAGKETST